MDQIVRCRVKLELVMKTACWPLWVVFFSAGSVSTETDYPDIVSIFSTDPKSQNHSSYVKSCLGQFAKMPGENSNGRPVWKHTDRPTTGNRKDRFFFNGKNNLWFCGYAYGDEHAGFISAKEMVGTDGLPESKWEHSVNGTWQIDPTLAIEGVK